jgi:hypothetical protein
VIFAIDQKPFIDGALDWMRRHDQATTLLFGFLVWMWLCSFIGGLVSGKKEK